VKLLLDQNLPETAAPMLRDAGLDAVHAREVELSRTADDEILRWARDHDRVIVTLDADFHALLALSEAVTPSVIRIRIESMPDREVADLIRRVVVAAREDLARGAVITVTEASIRMRHLPLSSKPRDP
jgi:predicted nuclease of predicted toxin-antitoxin system